jgi:hypothetical protein
LHTGAARCGICRLPAAAAHKAAASSPSLALGALDGRLAIASLRRDCPTTHTFRPVPAGRHMTCATAPFDWCVAAWSWRLSRPVAKIGAACWGWRKRDPCLHHPPSRRCSAILAFDLPPLSGGWLQDHGVR